MNKKKFLVLGLVLALAFSVVACSNKDEKPATENGETGQTEGPAGEKHKVYLITMDQMDQHWVTVDKGAKKAVEELGNVEYQWFAPDVKDDAKQIESINNAVAGGAEAILLAANGPDAVTAALKDAEAQGVKIVYVDSPADYPAVQTLATNNEEAGKVAGEEMLAALKEKGIESGKLGVISTNASTDSTVQRERGFRSAFEGTDFVVLETQYGDGDAAKSKDIAANYITEGVVGIFGANEGSTVGAGNAIKEAGEDVIGVGFDKSDTILQLIDQGFLLATMSQNPDVMGYEGVKTAVKVLEGGTVDEEFVDTGVSVIKKD